MKATGLLLCGFAFIALVACGASDVNQTALSKTEAATASNTVPINTPIPPMASPSATSLPVPTTATLQTLDAYLESYCCPEPIYFTSWLESFGYPRAHLGTNGRE
ncbi:MAG: hypothetical protein PVI78_07820 [Anaerolineales bacterium]